MSFVPVPVDRNNVHLIDRGTELYTYRIVDQDTTLTALSLGTDFKEIMIHVESGDAVIYVLGTISGSTTARITAQGRDFTIPICANADEAIASIAAPSTTVTVSIFAWR